MAPPDASSLAPAGGYLPTHRARCPAAECGVHILAADCTYWDLGTYGSPDAITPTIDRLASEGMQFNACYQTAPMCSPTRHNLYTGRYPARYGIASYLDSRQQNRRRRQPDFLPAPAKTPTIGDAGSGEAHRSAAPRLSWEA